jgi:hypothetical protein
MVGAKKREVSKNEMGWNGFLLVSYQLKENSKHSIVGKTSTWYIVNRLKQIPKRVL